MVVAPAPVIDGARWGTEGRLARWWTNVYRESLKNSRRGHLRCGGKRRYAPADVADTAAIRRAKADAYATLSHVDRRCYPAESKARACDYILAQIAAGGTAKAVCAANPWLPNHVTFYEWVVSDAELAESFVRARQAAAMQRIDDVDEVVRNRSRDSGENGHVHVSRDRLIADHDRWVLSKALPRIFGDKMQVDVSGNVSITLDTGIRRGASITATQDAEVTRVEPSRLIDESPSKGSLLD
jgi:hypothetical protein